MCRQRLSRSRKYNQVKKTHTRPRLRGHKGLASRLVSQTQDKNQGRKLKLVMIITIVILLLIESVDSHITEMSTQQQQQNRHTTLLVGGEEREGRRRG